MKRTLTLAAAGALFSGSLAFAADGVDHTVTLSAEIEPICSFPDTPVASEGEDYIDITSGASSTFTPDITPTGLIQNVTGALKFANAVCSLPTTLTFDNSDFVLVDSATPGFGTEIGYTVELKWGSQILASTTQASENLTILGDPVAPTNGDLVLRIETIPDATPLSPGTYFGTINLTLSST
jgi:hypothetical protein